MSDLAIRAEGLSKKYRIGSLKQSSYRTLRETIMGAASAPVRKLSRVKDGRQPDEITDQEIWALKDVSFEIHRGEVIGVIGSNGAGKSTLLKILSRITRPSTGSVDIYGRVASLLEVGTGFHPELTGRENVFLNGTILGMKRSEIDRHFDEIVAFSEIEKFIDTPVKFYSSGMYVRLAFAVAAYLEAEVMLVDEVLAVGDARFKRKSLRKISEVASDGRTVLFVSHNLSAVQALCESLIWLADGRIQSTGDVTSLINEYLHHTQSNKRVTSVEYPIEPTKPMQLLTACIDGSPSGVFSITDSLVFRLEVLTRTVVDRAYVTMNIRNANDIIVYWTSDIGSDRFLDPISGCTELICECPARLLTQGKYSADFAIMTLGSGKRIIDNRVEFRLIFEVEDTETVLASHNISYPGLTAIPSQWTVKSNAESTTL